jgi:hypothetical protein
VTLAQQLTRLETLLDSIDPAVMAWVTRALDDGAVPSHLSELQAEVEAFVGAACDAIESAGSGPAARRQALAEFLRHASRPSTPAPAAPAAPAPAPTHSIAELIHASDSADATGTISATVVDVWTTPGYTEYRLGDPTDTLVIGVTGSGDCPDKPVTGQEIVTTVRIARGAASITEPIDPRRPSVLGAVPAELVDFHTA